MTICLRLLIEPFFEKDEALDQSVQSDGCNKSTDNSHSTSAIVLLNELLREEAVQQHPSIDCLGHANNNDMRLSVAKFPKGSRSRDPHLPALQA